MAKFKIGDWVKITPNPDTRWSEWQPEIHDHFCDRIGYVDEFAEDMDYPNDLNEEYVKVIVYFDNNLFNNGPEHYFAWFKKRHIILSSEYEAERQAHMVKAADELQEYEEFVRNQRDEIFKHIFVGEKRKNSSNKLNDLEEDDWTNVITQDVQTLFK